MTLTQEGATPQLEPEPSAKIISGFRHVFTAH